MEIMVCAVVALIVFGPHRLPEIARTIGKTLNELKRQASDIRGEFEAGLDMNDDEPATPNEPAKSKPENPETEEL